jgi:hypothetical protein
MNSDIDDFLDHVDQWKFKLHGRLKRITPAQQAFCKQLHEQARARGVPVIEPERPSTRPTKRVRRTG